MRTEFWKKWDVGFSWMWGLPRDLELAVTPISFMQTRLVSKTPKNNIQIPLLRCEDVHSGPWRAFPDAAVLPMPPSCWPRRHRTYQPTSEFLPRPATSSSSNIPNHLGKCLFVLKDLAQMSLPWKPLLPNSASRLRADFWDYTYFRS